MKKLTDSINMLAMLTPNQIYDAQHLRSLCLSPEQGSTTKVTYPCLKLVPLQDSRDHFIQGLVRAVASLGLLG